MYNPFRMHGVSIFLFVSQRSRCMLQKERMRLYSCNAVTSTKSKTVKQIKGLLSSRKRRHESYQVVVEGPRMVFDLWENNRTRSLFSKIILDPEKWNSSLFSTGTASVLTASPEVLEACTDTVSNQGILAICNIPNLPIGKPRIPLFIVADAIQDPGNMGTILRSAAATGVAGVYILPNCCDPWNPKAVRSAMGMSFNVPLIYSKSWKACADALNEQDCISIYAATMLSNSTEGESHSSIDWATSPSAVIIGSEGNGLTDTVRDDISSGLVRAVHVPMEPGVESLNAAVCGSIIMFEYYRQRQIQS